MGIRVRVAKMRSLMDLQRIEHEVEPAGWWCSLCGGEHDARHCVEDVAHDIPRPSASPTRYPARLIAPGVTGGDLASVRSYRPTVGPVCVGSKFQSVATSFTYSVTRVVFNNIRIRRGGHVVWTSLNLLSNPRKWRRVA